MLSSYCHNCGAAKEPIDYSAPYCPACQSARSEAMQHFRAENPKATDSDVLHAGRAALGERAHHAHRNFVDPRGFSASRGMIPTPPQAGDRGTIPPA